MPQFSPFDYILPSIETAKHGYAYLYDAAQRWILFGDVLRKRGNSYLDHLAQDHPPVLAFDYEVLMDGRTLEQPVNYQLVKIMDRRHQTPGKTPLPDLNRRGTEACDYKTGHHPNKRPIVVIDPRAGHGPGIGGSKMDSQIGVALNACHPVYFILFLTDPMAGQTVAHVQQCQVLFLEEIARRHPEAAKPAIIGNCQAGWAAALIGADRPDLAGPLVLSGSPLSYWGGTRGASPMRYRGGLFGGSWLSSLASDLGNGQFDGAHLVAGFEELNIGNTLWTKMYHLYANVDTEEKRFLDFEKWWGGFFLLSREEINFIVTNLFINNELEQGFLKLTEGSYINLKNFKDPIVVFASKGDNITPPQQALNWIPKVYGSVKKIKEYGQVIIYLLHESIGHLGIFTSTQVNKKEHHQIIGCVDAIEFLAPGLYEMRIKKGPSKPWLNDHEVEFMERSMEDILGMDDGLEDEQAFSSVADVSKFNDTLYQEYISPWVRLFSTDFSAEVLKQAHPLRVQRYGFSDKNPFMALVKEMAEMVQKTREPADPENIFTKMETSGSTILVAGLNLCQQNRDAFYETLFYGIYANPWTKALFPPETPPVENAALNPEPERSPWFQALDDQFWFTAMKTGGFEQAVIRIILAISNSDRIFDMMEFGAAKKCLKADTRLKKITPDQMKEMIRDQSTLLEKDRKMALETLSDLILEKQDRLAALQIARDVVNNGVGLKPKETALIKKLEGILPV